MNREKLRNKIDVMEKERGKERKTKRYKERDTKRERERD